MHIRMYTYPHPRTRRLLCISEEDSQSSTAVRQLLCLAGRPFVSCAPARDEFLVPTHNVLRHTRKSNSLFSPDALTVSQLENGNTHSF